MDIVWRPSQSDPDPFARDSRSDVMQAVRKHIPRDLLVQTLRNDRTRREPTMRVGVEGTVTSEVAMSWFPWGTI